MQILLFFFTGFTSSINAIRLLFEIFLVKETVKDLAVIPGNSPGKPKHDTIKNITPCLERSKNKANDAKLKPESEGKVDACHQDQEQIGKKRHMSYFCTFDRISVHRIPVVKDMSDDKNHYWVNYCEMHEVICKRNLRVNHSSSHQDTPGKHSPTVSLYEGPYHPGTNSHVDDKTEKRKEDLVVATDKEQLPEDAEFGTGP